MNELSSFPGISLDKAESIFEVSYPKFSSNGKELHNEAEAGDTTFTLRDQDYIYDPEAYPLDLSWDVTIKENPSLKSLYDRTSENSCVAPGTILGIAIQWYSWSSRQRGTVMSDASINKEMEAGKKLTCKLNFKKASLRGSVSFKLILFVKGIGKDYAEYPQYASEIGTILGPISKEFTLLLDGNYSEFPIYTENVPGKPLWRMECISQNPETDLLGDVVSVYRNEADEKAAEMLKSGTKNFNIYLQREIFAGILIELIEYVRVIDSEFYCLENPEYGSLAHFLKYHKENNHIDFTDIVTVSRSVRQHFMK